MQVNVESLSSVKKKLNFEIPADHVSLEIDKAYAKIRQKAAIKGFRKGKVPQSLIEKHFGDQMAEDVLRTIFNETFFKALSEHKIFPIAEPLVDSDSVTKGEPLKYSATVEVFPEVDVTGYEGMEVKKEIFAFDEKVIESRLEELRQRAAQLQPAAEGYTAAAADFASIDFVGYIDNEPFENGGGQDYLLELGSGRFIPGFEDQIIGMKAGEEKRIKVTFPEAYAFTPLAGKDAEFDITVKEIKVKVFPELDDDFAKEMGEFDTLDALKAKMTEIYEQQEKERIDAQVRERVVQALIEANPVELPEAAVQRQLGYLLDDAKNRLAQQKLTLEMMGMDEENFKRDYRPVAETQVKGSLLLSALARKEGLKVADEDVAEYVNGMAASTGQDAEQISAFYRNNSNARDNLFAELVENKAIAFIVERVKIVEVSREELSPKEEPTA